MCRGTLDEVDIEGTVMRIAGALPVAEVDNFQRLLFAKSKDHAVTYRYSGYAVVPGRVDDRGSLAGCLVEQICKAKGREPRSTEELRCNSEM